jgi:hypothetical protein
VVIGCIDYLPDAQRLEIQPGVYQVRLFYGNDVIISNNLSLTLKSGAFELIAEEFG